jgi:hypothetical protein
MIPVLLMTCASLIAVDGDSVKCDGVNLRDMGDGAPFISGYDAPEIWSRKCEEELELARLEERLARQWPDGENGGVMEGGDAGSLQATAARGERFSF